MGEEGGLFCALAPPALPARAPSRASRPQSPADRTHAECCCCCCARYRWTSARCCSSARFILGALLSARARRGVGEWQRTGLTWTWTRGLGVQGACVGDRCVSRMHPGSAPRAGAGEGCARCDRRRRARLGLACCRAPSRDSASRPSALPAQHALHAPSLHLLHPLPGIHHPQSHSFNLPQSTLPVVVPTHRTPTSSSSSARARPAPESSPAMPG